MIKDLAVKAEQAAEEEEEDAMRQLHEMYEVAEQAARPYDLIVVNGAEITRFLPPGHSNAIFIKDANKLMIEDSKSFTVFWKILSPHY